MDRRLASVNNDEQKLLLGSIESAYARGIRDGAESVRFGGQDDDPWEHVWSITARSALITAAAVAVVAFALGFAVGR